MYNVHIEHKQYKLKDLIIKKHKNKKYILMKFNILIIFIDTLTFLITYINIFLFTQMFIVQRFKLLVVK